MLANGCGFIGGFGRMGGYNMMGGGWLMMLVPVLLIGLAIYAFMKMSQNNSTNNTGNTSNTNVNNSDALNILNKRYAQGDISEEEYIKKKNILKN